MESNLRTTKYANRLDVSILILERINLLFFSTIVENLAYDVSARCSSHSQGENETSRETR